MNRNFENDPFSIRSAVIENGVLNEVPSMVLDVSMLSLAPVRATLWTDSLSDRRATLWTFRTDGGNVVAAGNANLAIDLSWIENFYNSFFMADGGEMTIVLRGPMGEVELPYAF